MLSRRRARRAASVPRGPTERAARRVCLAATGATCRSPKRSRAMVPRPPPPPPSLPLPALSALPVLVRERTLPLRWLRGLAPPTHQRRRMPVLRLRGARPQRSSPPWGMNVDAESKSSSLIGRHDVRSGREVYVLLSRGSGRTSRTGRRGGSGRAHAPAHTGARQPSATS